MTALMLAGCGGGSHEVPPQPNITPLDQQAPPLPDTEQFRRATPPQLVARLDLEGTGDLYVGEWPLEPPWKVTVCYFAYAGTESDVEQIQLYCDRLEEPLELHEHAQLNGWPDVSVGTVASSIDAVRLTFEGSCGTETYLANGPFLRSNPPRHVFMLDQTGSCLWKTAEALRDGQVVKVYNKPAAPRD